MIKTISYEDFERARQMYGLPKHFPSDWSVHRTVYQIWVNHGQNFDTLLIVYPDGGYCRYPVLKKETHVFCESRPHKVIELLSKIQITTSRVGETATQSVSDRRPERQQP
jgi:hypothetical protein